jgi:hypothetical protein
MQLRINNKGLQPINRKQEKNKRSMPMQYSKSILALGAFAKSMSVSCTLSDADRPKEPSEQKTPAMKELKGSLFISTP